MFMPKPTVSPPLPLTTERLRGHKFRARRAARSRRILFTRWPSRERRRRVVGAVNIIKTIDATAAIRPARRAGTETRLMRSRAAAAIHERVMLLREQLVLSTSVRTVKYGAGER